MIISPASRVLFRIGLFTNLPMLGAVVLTFLMQMAVIYTPTLNDIFIYPTPANVRTCGLSSIVFIAICGSLLVLKVLSRWGLRGGCLPTLAKLSCVADFGVFRHQGNAPLCCFIRYFPADQFQNRWC